MVTKNVMRDLFAREALGLIPKLLTLQDRNPHSPTYGCFDRNFWQYKIIDFPSGMAQEFVYPLALAWALPLPDNPFRHQATVKTWVEAGIRYAARSAHPDGSCDDYFPYERASGAAAFSLLACLEAYRLCGLNAPELITFFERRARWLTTHQESGRLTNHQALIALCLLLLERLTGNPAWAPLRQARVELVLSWANPEGWFQEYEGCDPGYHSLTVGCLAMLQKLAPEPRVAQALDRAVQVARMFIHPDGTYGGEYGSRNTLNFFPHGFELAGQQHPDALRINNAFLEGLQRGLQPNYADDHILAHHAWSYLLAWEHFCAERPSDATQRPQRHVLPNAGMLREQRGDFTLLVALNKGGAFKLFMGNNLLSSDTGISLRVRDGGRLRTAVCHMIGHTTHQLEADQIVLRGELGWAKQAQMTPLKLMVLRAVMLGGGRLFPNLIRRLLQRLLITGKGAAPFQFQRTLRFVDARVELEDRITASSWDSVESAMRGGDQASIHVVMSRVYQPAQLSGWEDLTAKVKALKPGEPLVLHRKWP